MPIGGLGVVVVVVVVADRVVLCVQVDVVTVVVGSQLALLVEVSTWVKIKVLNLVVVDSTVAVVVAVRLGAQKVNATHSRSIGSVTAGMMAVLLLLVLLGVVVVVF